jgi:hypothetical protein
MHDAIRQESRLHYLRHFEQRESIRSPSSHFQSGLVTKLGCSITAEDPVGKCYKNLYKLLISWCHMNKYPASGVGREYSDYWPLPFLTNAISILNIRQRCKSSLVTLKFRDRGRRDDSDDSEGAREHVCMW